MSDEILPDTGIEEEEDDQEDMAQYDSDMTYVPVEHTVRKVQGGDPQNTFFLLDALLSKHHRQAILNYRPLRNVYQQHLIATKGIIVDRDALDQAIKNYSQYLLRNDKPGELKVTLANENAIGSGVTLVFLQLFWNAFFDDFFHRTQCGYQMPDKSHRTFSHMRLLGRVTMHGILHGYVPENLHPRLFIDASDLNDMWQMAHLMDPETTRAVASGYAHWTHHVDDAQKDRIVEMYCISTEMLSNTANEKKFEMFSNSVLHTIVNNAETGAMVTQFRQGLAEIHHEMRKILPTSPLEILAVQAYKSMHLDVDTVLSCMTYNVPPNSQALKYLCAALSHLDTTMLRRFMLFVTGGTIGVSFQVTIGEQWKAMVCFKKLIIPEYTTYNEFCEDFHLVLEHGITSALMD